MNIPCRVSRQQNYVFAYPLSIDLLYKTFARMPDRAGRLQCIYEITLYIGIRALTSKFTVYLTRRLYHLRTFFSISNYPDCRFTVRCGKSGHMESLTECCGDPRNDLPGDLFPRCCHRYARRVDGDNAAGYFSFCRS